MSGSVLTLFHHLNKSKPPDCHPWTTEFHSLKTAESNGSHDPSCLPYPVAGEKLYIDGPTTSARRDSELMQNLEEDQKQESGVYLDGSLKTWTVVSPYSGYCTTSKCTPGSPTSKSFDLSIDLNVGTFDSQQDKTVDNNCDLWASTCDIADSPQSTDSNLVCRNTCDVSEKVELLASSASLLDSATDLKAEGVERAPEQELQKQLPPDYMPSGGLQNPTKEDKGFSNPISMNFDLAAKLEGDEDLLNKECCAKNLDFETVIFYDEGYLCN